MKTASSQSRALIVIDVQNDYFPGGKLPLWQANDTLRNILSAIERAKKQASPIIIVQHIVDPALGFTRFFVPDTPGVQLHPALAEALPDAPVIVKHHTDAFFGTGLNALLADMGIREALFCGMQTQNCVGLTAISHHAENIRTVILSDCCTAETEMVHQLALYGFGDITTVTDSIHALG